MAYYSTIDERYGVAYTSSSAGARDAPTGINSTYVLAPGILNTGYGATIPYLYTADTDTYSLGVLSPGKYTIKADGWNWDYSNSIYGYSTPTVEVRTSTGYLVGTSYLGSYSFNVTQASTFYVSVLGTSYSSSEYKIYYTYDGALPNSPATGNLSVSGSLSVGSFVSAAGSYYDANGTVGVALKYQWFYKVAGTTLWIPIAGATSSSYQLTSNEANKYIGYDVTFTDNAGYAETLSAVTANTVAAPDTTAPTLSSITPADEATGVAVGANFVFTFSEAVKAGTGSFVVKSGATTVSTIAVTDTSQVTFSGSTVTINPTSNLDYSKSYSVSVDAGVIKDIAGNNWVGTGTNPYDFTTVAAPDTTAPSLSGVSPVDGATGVAVSANFVLTFNEAVKAGTGSFVVKNGSTTVATIAVTDTSQVTFSGSTVTINPASNLDYSKSYSVSVDAGVIKDIAGNNWAGTGTNPYDFTTVAAPNSAPTLTSFGTSVKSTNEDTAVSISFAELLSKGNEADVDGSVTSFVVKAVSTGMLKIGATATTATAWSTTNNTVDSTKSAFWTPAANANGTLNAFTAVAKDDLGVESATAVQAKVAVKYELGTGVIDLGTQGKLINPVQIDGGKYFYFWDKNGNGIVDENTQDSFKIYQELDKIFTQNKEGFNQYLSSKIDENYRFATINGVNVALPTVNGGKDLLDTNTMLLGVQPAGTSIGSSNTTQGDLRINDSYNDLAALWDAYNGVGTTSNLYGVPANWAYGGYWSATPASGSNSNYFASSAGTFRESSSNYYGYVALELIDSRLIVGSNNADNLVGTINSDAIYAWSGNDTLDGGSGADVMWGGAGNDVYYVDNASDQTNEAISSTNTADAGGTDLVYSSVTHTLGNYLENLTLTGTAAINGTGNGLANTITGNSAVNTLTGGDGNDTLDGGAGTDNLIGGAGNDTYIVDLYKTTGAIPTLALQDTITEAASAGNDTLKLRLATNQGLGAQTFALTGTLANLENLDASNTSINLINLTGNGLANTLTGNSAVNTLKGEAGLDILNGGLGNDILTGGSEADYFDFTTALGPTNIDTITDFTLGSDKIRLENSVMTKLQSQTGILSQTAYWEGAGITTGHDADDRILYDTSSGKLYYDADGIGSTAAVQIALIGTTSHANLDHTDFAVI